MAKKSGLKKTIKEAPKIIQVKSSTYGVHTRAARGSKSPAVLNDDQILDKQIDILNDLLLDKD